MLGNITRTGCLRHAVRRTLHAELLILCARVDYNP